METLDNCNTPENIAKLISIWELMNDRGKLEDTQ